MGLTIISPAQGLSSAFRALNIVVLSEGFVARREGVFVSEVTRFNRVLRTTSPFHRFGNLLTVSALFVPSNTSIPVTDATRCAWRVPNAAGQIPADDAPSPFDTAFGALYCRRRDTTPARKFVERALAGDNAKVEAAIKAVPALAGLRCAALVLVDNDTAFGGLAPGKVGWFSMQKDLQNPQNDWTSVAIHELGHSEFNLADEYDNEGPAVHAANEPDKPNITTFRLRGDLVAFSTATAAKLSLQRWSDLMDPATPAPTSQPNPTCVAIEPRNRQAAKPGVHADAVGLFEGADNSPCAVFRPRLDCRMRHSAADFCPVCDWSISAKLAAVDNRMRVDGRATITGASTVMGVYHEVFNPNTFELSRLVLYAGATGDYQIFDSGVRDPPPAHCGRRCRTSRLPASRIFWRTVLRSAASESSRRSPSMPRARSASICASTRATMQCRGRTSRPSRAAACRT